MASDVTELHVSSGNQKDSFEWGVGCDETDGGTRSLAVVTRSQMKLYRLSLPLRELLPAQLCRCLQKQSPGGHQ